MSATITLLKEKCPEFSTVDDSTLTSFLDTAAHFVNRGYFGEALADIVQCYYAAHLMKLLGTTAGSGAGASGDVASETLGPLSVTYATAQPAAEYNTLGQTNYGKQIQVFINTKKLQKGLWLTA